MTDQEWHDLYHVDYKAWRMEMWRRYQEYIVTVVLPAAIRDAETNPNNPWYKAYENYPNESIPNTKS